MQSSLSGRPSFKMILSYLIFTTNNLKWTAVFWIVYFWTAEGQRVTVTSPNNFKLMARIWMKFSGHHYWSSIFSVQCIHFSTSFKQFSNKLNCNLRFLKTTGHHPVIFRSPWGRLRVKRALQRVLQYYSYCYRVILEHLNHVLTQSWEVKDYFYLKGRLYFRILGENFQI